jgi:hypothetical protein
MEASQVNFAYLNSLPMPNGFADRAGVFPATRFRMNVWTGKEPAIIQVQYMGPSAIDFINPADDPRNK